MVSSSISSLSSGSSPVIRSRILRAFFVLAIVFFFIRISLRVLLEGCFSSESSVNVRLWDFSLFGESVHQDGNVSAMKEIQDAVIHVSLPCPKLVDAIAYEVGLGTAKLMSCCSEPPNTGDAFRIRPAVALAKLCQPLHHWHAAPLILVKVDLSLWHRRYLYL